MSPWPGRVARLAWVSYAVGAAAWLTWFGSLALGGGRFDAYGQPFAPDHVAFYSAARLVLAGRGADVYDFPHLPALIEYQSGLVGRPYLNAFRNPPLYALLYAPTARLDWLTSALIWTAVSLLAFAAGLFLLCRESKRSATLRGVASGRVTLHAFAFYPAVACVGFGQNSLLSFFAFALVYALTERDRRLLAGLAAGLLLFKPQLLFGLGLWWLLDVRRKWPCLLGLTAAAIMFVGSNLAFLPDETRLYASQLPSIAEYNLFWFYNLVNPRGFGTMIAGDDKAVGNVFGIAGMAVGVVWFALLWRRQRGDDAVCFAAAAFVTLWASPHAMLYEWSLVLIPAILLWTRVPEGRPAWRVSFAVGWLALTAGTPLAKLMFDACGFAILVAVPVLAWSAEAVRRELARLRPAPAA